MPGAVLAGVPVGLTSWDGGNESPLGPTAKVGAWRGCDETPSAEGAEVGADGFLEGEADRCGVMTSAGGRKPGTATNDGLVSLDFVPAGVRGGECTVECGGEILGDAGIEPACMNLLLGVMEPDGTFVLLA